MPFDGERWDVAWQRALYGPEGFYRKASGPATQFRTSVHASALLADALARLARTAGLTRVVDVGSGRGELLVALSRCAPDLRLVGVDVVERPTALPDGVHWLTAPGGALLSDDDSTLGGDALVVAHEWLDDVPCPVLQVDDDGELRTVVVDPSSGVERLGGSPPARQLSWAERWWRSERDSPGCGSPGRGSPGRDSPGRRSPGARVEVGLFRDKAWAELVARSPGSLLLAVDYAHDRDDRPPDGTLLGYRDGRACLPVPDGSCDVTAHVALDAVAAAGIAAGASASVLTTQREGLRALGVDPRLPDAARASADPRAYLAALERASQATELLDPAGLGGFGWLLQSTGPQLPQTLAARVR